MISLLLDRGLLIVKFETSQLAYIGSDLSYKSYVSYSGQIIMCHCSYIFSQVVDTIMIKNL